MAIFTDRASKAGKNRVNSHNKWKEDWIVNN